MQMNPFPGASNAGTCPYCGAGLYGNEVYCINCGRRLGAQGQTQVIENTDMEQPELRPWVATPPVAQQPAPQPYRQPEQAAAAAVYTGALVAPLDIAEDDEPLLRHKLLRLTREEARRGCVKTVRVDGGSYNIQIPVGVNGNVQLRVPNLGYADKRGRGRGDMLISFHIS